MKADNEIIAEFMGKSLFYEYERSFPSKKRTKRNLKYNTSWSWLMPVVEKINEPEVKGDQLIRSAANVQIFYKACHINFQPDEDFEDMEEKEIQTQGETKLEAVYKAVVEFIKWHNSQKLNP